MEYRNAKEVDERAADRPEGRIARLGQFVREARNELTRVTWPSGREVYATTVVVIVVSIALGLYLKGIDVLLDRVDYWLFGWTS